MCDSEFEMEACSSIDSRASIETTLRFNTKTLSRKIVIHCLTLFTKILINDSDSKSQMTTKKKKMKVNVVHLLFDA